MKEEKLRAIVLKHVPYKDSQAILTVLSEERGLVTIFLKGLSKKNPTLIATTNPLCEAEFLCYESNSQLLKCKEVSIINPHYFLREKYSYLSLGLTLAKTILETQFPEKNSPALYFLLSCYLKKIPYFEDKLKMLHSSFLLKILKHEGLIHHKARCLVCGTDDKAYFSASDFFCEKHKPLDSISISNSDWLIIQALTHSVSFNEIKSLPASSELLLFIEHYFQTIIRTTAL